GCCVSRSAGPNSPYPGGAPNTSARPINPPPLTLHDSARSGNESPSRRRRHDRPLAQHIDKPLRRHQWYSEDRQWTSVQLARERDAFFDTRVTGRSEVWQTIHAALRIMWEPAEQDASDDGLATAQSILSAAEISLPTGDLVNGAYDSLGNYYQFPEWIVSDPENIAESGDTLDTVDHKGDSSLSGGKDDDEDDDNSDGERRRQRRGKAVVDVREQITIRARLSENGRDVIVSAPKSEAVGSLARRIGEESGLLSSKRIRMAYMGKILKENASLEAQGWRDGHVVNALVFDKV
ncbi:hypothetical protein S7711_08988, partial [Stachybotrys chartarum IBT 7711]